MLTWLVLIAVASTTGLHSLATRVALVVACTLWLWQRLSKGRRDPNKPRSRTVSERAFRALGRQFGAAAQTRGLSAQRESHLRIPSRGGGAELDARVQWGDGSSDIAVVLTHPWGWLGGDMQYPLVERLAVAMGAFGMTVCRFNFGGVGRSTGSKTFTSRAEEADLESVIDALKQGNKAIRRVVLVGYSYGSVIASAVGGRRVDVVGYVAISYPYSVAWALALCNSRRLLGDAATAADSKQAAPKQRLLIMGGSDDFTSESSFWELVYKFEEGDRRADGREVSQTRSVLVEEMNHGWLGRELSVATTIICWLSGNIENPPTRVVEFVEALDE